MERGPTTFQPSATQPDVQIRTARHVWIPPLVFGAVWLALATLQLLLAQHVFAVLWLALGCASLYQGKWLRTLGVDLTPEFADLRGQRRRRVAWRDVQAVVRHRRQGAWQVRLILESGKPENLRAPTTLWNFGAAQYERDFHRIGQWWLVHRGESWRPVRPEAPQPEDQWW
jgi:hypothetical protein